MDDLVDTADTITDAAKVLKAEGAKNIYAFTSHGIFTGPAIRRILVSPIDELLILDTVPLSDAVKVKCSSSYPINCIHC